MGALAGGAGIEAAAEGRDERAGTVNVGDSVDGAAVDAAVAGTLLMGTAVGGRVENDATVGGADADDAGTDGDGVTVDMAFNVMVGASVEACGWINDTEMVAAGEIEACVTGFAGCEVGAAVEGAPVCNAGELICDKVGFAVDGDNAPDVGGAIFV